MRSIYTAALVLSLVTPAVAQVSDPGGRSTAQGNTAAQGGTTPLPPMNAPGTQPQSGGGVTAGPGAPTSALPLDPSTRQSTDAPGRGAPAPGMSAPSGLGSSTGGSNITPGGAIRPGSTPGGGGTGGSGGSSGGGGG